MNYEAPGPVGDRFLQSRAFVKGIMGPIGSGKTTACIIDILLTAAMQPKNSDGKRRSRFAITRNSYPELNTTTIKSWHEWMPQEIGRWQSQGPPTHFIEMDDGVEAEVMFIALDRPDDVRKLLSLELTAAYMNEAREQPKAILDGLTGRVGRFPPVRDGGCVYPHIVMDTNAPDLDHWWYKLAEETHAEGFEFFRQKGGLDPDAENVPNLPPGYYDRVSSGKADDWLKVYVRSEYGYVRDGKPVYPEFVDSLHVRPFELVRGFGLRIGLDFGLTPAAVIGARSPMGGWRIRREVVATRMGATALAVELGRELREHFPDWPVESITGDPAGDSGGNDEKSVFQILAANGIIAQPASTNDFTIRRDAVGGLFSKLIDGEPAMLIHPDCKVLRKACAGAYCFKRVQVLGHERYKDKPDKNEFSHVAEALQYEVLGGGEGKLLIRRTPTFNAPQQADVDYPTFTN